MACASIGPSRWFHVRVSQTEPIVRVICEQRGEPPQAAFERILEYGEELCRVRVHLLKVGVSGIRGVVGEFLTPSLARAFAQAFGDLCRRQAAWWWAGIPGPAGRCCSTPSTCGLLAAGCEVIDVGVLPTPTIQIYIGAIRARGGLALTASHNPPEYNALKLFNSQGLFFNTYERSELLDLYHQSDFHQATNDEIRRVSRDHEVAAAACMWTACSNT